MPIGFGSRLLLSIRGKFKSLVEDLDDIPSHQQRDITLRFFKRLMDAGNPFTAVPLTSSSFKPSRFPNVSGNSSSFEQPDNVRIFRDVQLQQEFGRLERILQSLRSNLIRPVKH